MITPALIRLSDKERELREELEDIEALKGWIAEAKQLMRRLMTFVGVFTKEEFEKCPSYTYICEFLDDKLEQQ